jgi:hypothetical protein
VRAPSCCSLLQRQTSNGPSGVVNGVATTKVRLRDTHIAPKNANVHNTINCRRLALNLCVWPYLLTIWLVCRGDPVKYAHYFFSNNILSPVSPSHEKNVARVHRSAVRVPPFGVRSCVTRVHCTFLLLTAATAIIEWPVRSRQRSGYNKSASPRYPYYTKKRKCSKHDQLSKDCSESLCLALFAHHLARVPRRPSEIRSLLFFGLTLKLF